MSDTVFNIAKGAVAEKVRDSASVVGVLLLKVAEADATLQDYATVAAILAGSNTEANFTTYARKTAITATVTVDNSGNKVVVAIPSQTWASAGGATNNSLVKAIVFYEESASDAGRVPLVALDYVITTDGTDILLTVGPNGIYQAA